MNGVRDREHNSKCIFTYHSAHKYALYLFREENNFRERSLRKTVSFEKQIMSKNNNARTFSPQMEAIVFIILQMFFATRAVMKIEYHSGIPQFFLRNIQSRYALKLDQSKSSRHFCVGNHTVFLVQFGINLHEFFKKLKLHEPLPRVQFQLFEKLARANLKSKLNEKNRMITY